MTKSIRPETASRDYDAVFRFVAKRLNVIGRQMGGGCRAIDAYVNYLRFAMDEGLPLLTGVVFGRFMGHMVEKRSRDGCILYCADPKDPASWKEAPPKANMPDMHHRAINAQRAKKGLAPLPRRYSVKVAAESKAELEAKVAALEAPPGAKDPGTVPAMGPEEGQALNEDEYIAGIVAKHRPPDLGGAKRRFDELAAQVAAGAVTTNDAAAAMTREFPGVAQVYRAIAAVDGRTTETTGDEEGR